MNKDISNQDILEAINSFSSHMDTRLTGIEGRVGSLEVAVGSLEVTVGSLEVAVHSLQQRVTDLEQTVTGVKANMVTKEYLDDKMADAHGDIMDVLYNSNKKTQKIVEKLEEHKVIDKNEAIGILRMPPFPKAG